MKIEVITLHGVWNYGSVLQALATQSFFEQLGCTVEFINYKRNDFRSIGNYLCYTCKDDPFLKSILKSLVLLPTVIHWKRMFGIFCTRNLNISKREYITNADFYDYIPQADIYCTGSDQVWNSTLNNGTLPHFFLDFVPEGKKRISFSSSFGKELLDDWEIDEVRQLLNRYDYITCRESSGVNICHSLGLKQVHRILDPTLLLSSKYWKKFVRNRPVKQKYLLVYQLHKEEGMDDYLKEIAHRCQLKIVRVCYRYDEIRKQGYSLLIPTIDKLLSAIYYASLEVTDSFHVTAFSTNFQKDFISVIPTQQFGGRIYDLLTLTGLKARAICQFDDFSPLDNIIDWQYVERVYDMERKTTTCFFEKMLKDK